MASENNVKICPFNGEECKEDKCALWAEVGVMRPGMVAAQKEGMCAFQALVLIAGSPRPMMVPQGMKIKLPNLVPK